MKSGYYYKLFKQIGINYHNYTVTTHYKFMDFISDNI